MKEILHRCVNCDTKMIKVYTDGNLYCCPNKECSEFLNQKNLKRRTKKERQKFLKEHDGWTEFKLEKVTMFGKEILMAKCVKCNHIESLQELFSHLFPLHCSGCGRTTLEQDREMYKKALYGDLK